MKSIIRFFQHLQNQDESVRRTWLWILSGSSMTIVLLLWVGYLKAIIPVSEGPLVERTPEEAGFRESFKAGLIVVGKGTGNVLKQGGEIAESAKNRLQEDHTITIEPPAKNFILDTLEAIPPTLLP